MNENIIYKRSVGEEFCPILRFFIKQLTKPVTIYYLKQYVDNVLGTIILFDCEIFYDLYTMNKMCTPIKFLSNIILLNSVKTIIYSFY